MNAAQLSRCNPHLLDFVTWTVKKGSRLFGRVAVLPENGGLVATELIPKFELVSLTPASSTVSIVSMREGNTFFPILCSPLDYGESMPLFKYALNRGSFSLICFLASVLLSSKPTGLHSYLRLLPLEPNMPMELLARDVLADNKKFFDQFTAPLLQYLELANTEKDALFGALAKAHALFRRYAVPLWSENSGGRGLNYFKGSSFVRHSPQQPHKEWSGEILGLVPLTEFAGHSCEPNAAIGYPDEEILRWVQQEKTLQSITPYVEDGCISLQALRDILPGERITVDKNLHFGLPEDVFLDWFGVSYNPEYHIGGGTSHEVGSPGDVHSNCHNASQEGSLEAPLCVESGFSAAPLLDLDFVEPLKF